MLLFYIVSKLIKILFPLLVGQKQTHLQSADIFLDHNRMFVRNLLNYFQFILEAERNKVKI